MSVDYIKCDYCKETYWDWTYTCENCGNSICSNWCILPIPKDITKKIMSTFNVEKHQDKDWEVYFLGKGEDEDIEIELKKNHYWKNDFYVVDDELIRFQCPICEENNKNLDKVKNERSLILNIFEKRLK